MSWRAVLTIAATSFTANPTSPCGGVERTSPNGKVLTHLQDAHLSTFNISHKLLKKKEGIQGVQGAQVCTRARLAHHHRPAYSPPIAAHSAIGRGNPCRRRRNGAATALFCCVTPSQFYGGRVGQASAWPGSYVPGFPPRHVRRLNRVETIGGGSSTRHRNQVMAKHTRVAPSATALRELIQSHDLTVVDATPAEDGEYLLTPRVIRHIGFGRNPFRTYPKVQDPRVVGVAEYLPPGTPRSDGELSRHWAAVLVRADGVTEYLMITCLRDATDALFEHLSAADKAQLAAPFGQEAA